MQTMHVYATDSWDREINDSLSITLIIGSAIGHHPNISRSSFGNVTN